MTFQKQMMNPNSFPILLGPCVAESEQVLFEIARGLEKIISKLEAEKLTDGVVWVFKASYDKANRSSINGFRGPGLEEGLKQLAKVKQDFGFALVSDVHETSHCAPASEVLDILQIPAFLCRQTDLIVAAAQTNKVLNIKKGQFLSPPEIKNIVDKAREAGNTNVFICERGNSFGYNNLVVDMRMFQQAREMGIRTIFDATHSCQLPGAGGDKSLGNSHFAPILARAAVAAGATGIFAETHPRPEDALSDGPNMIKLDELEAALRGILEIRALNKSHLTV
ncbi:MAG: 3-deoxy-8-phosphooctulonate synthase [Cyanobacteria bacterium]|nr:3-deoxy-8-phosphooctulonate synthase [Cyanobacteriota bacterium]MDA1021078.1 3-deoxy-8-phosphooctulonate synthase [Cyanobacteriota bacterium]